MGAGRIGSLNDSRPNSVPLSHVGAALAAGGIRLSAVVEPDAGRRQAAEVQWQGRSQAAFVGSLDALPEKGADVVALCTPTETREDDVAAALTLCPRILLVEKPLAATFEEADRVLHTVDAAGVDLRVNYNRRFDPATHRFQSLFPGAPLSIVARYGKGLNNYASHMIDLFRVWCGPVRAVQALSRVRPLGNDISVSFRLEMDVGVDVYIVSLDNLSFDQFEIDVFFSDRVLSYTAGGAAQLVRTARQDLHYRGFSHLPAEADDVWAGQVGGFREIYEGLRDHLVNGSALGGCTGREALEVQSVIEGVRESASADGRVVNLSSVDQ